MNLGSLCVKLVVGAALTLPAPWVSGQDGLEGAWSRANLASPANLGVPFTQTLAAADFDGDSKVDGAVLVDHGWPRSQGSIRTIELHLFMNTVGRTPILTPAAGCVIAATPHEPCDRPESRAK